MSESERIERSSLRGFHKDLVAIVEIAQDYGWTARRIASGAVRLTAPDGTTLSVPHTTKLHRNVQSMRRKVVKHADPMKLAAISGVVNGAPGAEVTLGGERGRVTESGDIVFERVVESRSEPEPVLRSVVDERPYLSHRKNGPKGGTRYPSPFVVERVWSDGSIDYRCRFCDFSSDRVKSVSTHAARAHRGEYDRDSEREYVFDPDYTEPVEGKRPRYTPSERLLSALTDALAEVLAGLTADDVPGTGRLREGMALVNRVDLATVARAAAEGALRWMHDRPDLPDPVEREPLTDEQIVARIRTLVEGGETVRLRSVVDDLTGRLEATEKALARTRSSLATFAAMAAEEAAAD